MPEQKKRKNSDPAIYRPEPAPSKPSSGQGQGQGQAKRSKSPKATRTPKNTLPPSAPTEPVNITPPSFDPPEYVVIAQVAAPFGLRGAVKANIQTDFPDRFEQLEEVHLSPPGKSPEDERQAYKVVEARLQSEKQVVLRFEGITKVEQAEELRGYNVAVPVGEVVPLPEGEYYIFQIVGLDVFSTDDRFIGRVVNVEKLPASDIYVVRGPLSDKDVLVPAVKDIVKEIDLEAKRITIELLEGMLPDEVV